MATFFLTRHAQQNLEKLQPSVRERIMKKLIQLRTHPDIFVVLKPLHDFAPATHRLRIGPYRLILELIKNAPPEFWVIDVGHRKDIYL